MLLYDNSEKIKWTCRILRFFTYLYGFSLVFLKINDEKLVQLTSSLIKSSISELFLEVKSTTQKDHLQPLIINFGKDSIEEIGDPKINSGANSLIELWEDTAKATFKDAVLKNKKKNNFSEQEYMDKYTEKTLDYELVAFEKRNNRINDMTQDSKIKKKKKKV